MAILRTAKYLKSDLCKNNNKFWDIYEHDDCTVITKWGRVGDVGQSKPKDFPSQDAAATFFDKKCKEKERSGRNGEIAYRPANIVGDGGAPVKQDSKVVANTRLKDIATKQIKTNNPIVTKLITYLTKVNAHNITEATGGQITYNDTTGLFSTPLGIVGQENIDSANDLLIEIGDIVSKGNYGEKLKNRTNDYLMLIPQDIGRRRLEIKTFWGSLGDVQKQKSIVDSLQASLTSASQTPQTPQTPQTKAKKDIKPEAKVFDVQLDLVEDDKIIKGIRCKYKQTNQSRHACSHLDVKTVYTVEIATMKNMFDKCSVGNVMSLYHGSRVENLLSILKGGLIMPSSSSSNVTGKMFSGYPGKEGLYFSDQSSKSLNYAYGYWSGKRDNNCFMFLADVKMGKYHVPAGPSSSLPKKGCDSTFAKAHKSGVYNNEMIVYSVEQVNLTHLIEYA